jgi:hypothetical protein
VQQRDPRHHADIALGQELLGWQGPQLDRLPFGLQTSLLRTSC